MSLSLVQGLLSEVGFAPSAASVEHVNGPTLPIISRSYVDTEFHGSLNSPVVNFADSNESLGTRELTQMRGELSDLLDDFGPALSAARIVPPRHQMRDPLGR